MHINKNPYNVKGKFDKFRDDNHEGHRELLIMRNARYVYIG